MKFSERFKNRGLNNTGFDTNTGNSSGRVANKDGSSNVKKIGINIFERTSMYHTLINLRPSYFLLITLSSFMFCNIIFALMYYVVGIEQLGGSIKTGSEMNDFLDCFFFSTQTITTVGYGILHPLSIATNMIASFETLFGWMAFAVLTGLLYGRFSKPKAYLKFSKNALLTPHKDLMALMLRIAPFKNNTLTDAEVLINIVIKVEENGKRVNRFFTLAIEFPKVSSLALNWTVVHLIDESSPLWQMTKDEMIKSELELLVFVKAYDEHFSNMVQQRTSYTAEEIVMNAKFEIMFRQSDDKQTTLLELDKINDYKFL